ncbi:MAG: TIGR03936 family radical SAM-associated protein [Aristaeellaceae bacterium]
MMAVFEKSERLRHIGHLDIQRAVQRALRRSGLPVSYSKGFNPHILLTFASALSTGYAGRNEIMEVHLERDVTPEVFVRAMNGAMPPDMQLSSARVLEERHAALMAQVAAADYTLTVGDAQAAEAIAAKLDAFLAQPSIPAMRKTKSGMKETDIRPLILALTMDGRSLRAVMTLTERLACKPGMLLDALAAFCGLAGAPRAMVVRNRLLGLTGDGELAPLETL